MSRRKKQTLGNKTLHICIILFLVIVICGLAAIVMLKYHVEGETDAVFDISKILVISTAEAVSKENPTAKWDCNINQNNDIYITIEKNSKKSDAIKTVTINNIKITQAPTKGSICFYKPAQKGLFKCEENYKIENEVQYKGSKTGSINNLEISNQGGTIILRICNSNVSEYKSNDDEQIFHDGTLLKKTNVNLEEIKTKLQLDIIIETESGIKYKTSANVELPVGNILEEGTSTNQINAEDLILKRI